MAELAWPEDIGHGTFTGRFGFMDADSHDPDREPDITSATGGTVTITPSIRSVRYTGAQGPMILAARPAKGIIDAEGYLCTLAADGSPGDRGMVFPATDDTDLTPTDWTYTVSILLDGGVRLPAFDVKLPEGSTVDLSAAVPIPPSGGTAIVVDPTTAERAENAATRAETAAAEAEEYAPSFVWDGTALVIDGGDPVDLKGEKGDGSSWAELTGKPTSFPSTVADVDGLAARLAALEYDSGVRTSRHFWSPAGRAPCICSGRVRTWSLPPRGWTGPLRPVRRRSSCRSASVPASAGVSSPSALAVGCSSRMGPVSAGTLATRASSHSAMAIQPALYMATCGSRPATPSRPPRPVARHDRSRHGPGNDDR